MTVRSETVDTKALASLLDEHPEFEGAIIDEALISRSTLTNVKRGYQPHENTAKRINAAVAKLSGGPETARRKSG